MSSLLVSGRLPDLAKETPVWLAAGEASSKDAVTAATRGGRGGVAGGLPRISGRAQPLPPTRSCAESYPSFTGPEGDGQPLRDPLQTSPHLQKAREHDMNQHTLLMHTNMRDSPELARRIATLASFERVAREARRRRRREFVGRNLNRLSVFHRDGDARVQPREGPAVGEALR